MMKKKHYQTPAQRVIACPARYSLLAGSEKTGVSDSDATNPSYAPGWSSDFDDFD